MNRSTLLRRILQERRAVPVPGCHDALSAKVIESCDFEALQISGLGVAGSLLAKARRAWACANQGCPRQCMEHLTGGRHTRHGRHRYGWGQCSQCSVDHGTPDRHWDRRDEHRGSGLPETMRPSERKGSHRHR